VDGSQLRQTGPSTAVGWCGGEIKEATRPGVHNFRVKIRGDDGNNTKKHRKREEL